MLRIGIAGCGRVARIHLGRLLQRGDVEIVGLTDPDVSASKSAGEILATHGQQAPCFSDHKELLSKVTPQAIAVFAPHRAHYRLAMDALQAGCHVFIEKPLSTNSQEADDIVNLARGRNRVVAVGHQYRLRPSLREARRLISEGAIGPITLVAATLAAPWLAKHQDSADAWRLDPKLAGGGILADVGDHLLDALLWSTGQPAAEVAAFQTRVNPALDVVTAAIMRLADGTPATLGLTGICGSPLFEISYFGELGHIKATDLRLRMSIGQDPEQEPALPGEDETIDSDFVTAITQNRAPCCPAEDVLATVRLLEAIARSATSGQVVRLA